MTNYESKKQIITAWISKYALSSGQVLPMKVETDDSFPGMAINREYALRTFHGSDWHRSKEDACAKAEEMRVRKIASLKKQIAKLEKMRFEP